MATEEQLDRLVSASNARSYTTQDMVSFGQGPDARQRATQLILDEDEYKAALEDATVT